MAAVFLAEPFIPLPTVVTSGRLPVAPTGTAVRGGTGAGVAPADSAGGRDLIWVLSRRPSPTPVVGGRCRRFRGLPVSPASSAAR